MSIDLIFVFGNDKFNICGREFLRCLLILKEIFFFFNIVIIIFLYFLYLFVCVCSVCCEIFIVFLNLIIFVMFLVLVCCLCFCFFLNSKGDSEMWVVVYKKFIFFGLLILWVEMDKRLIFNCCIFNGINL